MKIRILLVFLIMISINNNINATDNINLYDFSFEDIDGNQVELEKFTGKPILVVNTASRCGFTPQYANLQNLFLEYKDSDLTIIATSVMVLEAKRASDHLEKNGVKTRVIDTVLFVDCSPIDNIKEVVESYKQTHLFHHPV